MKTTMKKSRKYMLRSLLSVYAFIFIFVGVNRATENRDYEAESESSNTPVEELVTLTGFTTIEVRGDFNLQVNQGDDYAISFTAPREDEGNFHATMNGETLVLNGFGNRQDFGPGLVRVTMPELLSLSSDFNPEVNISGFVQERMQIDLLNNTSVNIKGNTLDVLAIDANSVDEMFFAENLLSLERFTISGQTDITRQ